MALSLSPAGTPLRNFVLLAALLAVSAFAGETFLGRIYVSDGGTVSNASTGYGSAGCSRQQDVAGAGACDQAFPLGTGIKLLIQSPDSDCCVSTNRATTDAGICFRITANQMLPVSLSNSPQPAALPDGGSYNLGLISIAPPPGSAACRLNVFLDAY